jgi:hypothetical protein
MRPAPGPFSAAGSGGTAAHQGDFLVGHVFAGAIRLLRADRLRVGMGGAAEHLPNLAIASFDDEEADHDRRVKGPARPSGGPAVEPIMGPIPSPKGRSPTTAGGA